MTMRAGLTAGNACAMGAIIPPAVAIDAVAEPNAIRNAAATRYAISSGENLVFRMSWTNALPAPESIIICLNAPLAPIIKIRILPNSMLQNFGASKKLAET